MAKLTLLQMVQNILNDMDSDNVNSIDDTVESLQVAEIIRESYFYLVSRRDWPWLREKFSLTGLGDTDNPTKMLIPDNYSKVFWIKYNGNDVTFMEPKAFQDLIDNREEQADVVDANGFVLNRDPIYYTSFDDEYFIFDGYDADAENTLTSANTTCYGVRIPTWEASDGYIPDMPDKVFPTFLADAKASCFLSLKQQANQREERKAQRGHNIMQNEAWRNNASEGKYNGKVNYGRK